MTHYNCNEYLDYRMGSESFKQEVDEILTNLSNLSTGYDALVAFRDLNIDTQFGVASNQLALEIYMDSLLAAKNSVYIGFNDVNGQPLKVGDKVQFVRVTNVPELNQVYINYLTTPHGKPDIVTITDDFIYGKCAFTNLSVNENHANYTGTITKDNVIKVYE